MNNLELVGGLETINSLIEPEGNEGIEKKIYTTVTDEKTLFNLEGNCDYKINDCVGEKIVIQDVVIKKFKKKLKEPVVDEGTGNIIKEYETSMVTIIIDENGKSYVTASKIFTIKFMKLIEIFGEEKIRGMVIEICKQSIKDSDNKALGFKLI